MDANLERDERKSSDRSEASRRNRQSESDDTKAKADLEAGGGEVSENNHGCSSYPPEIFFILFMEACERLSYYGTKGILNEYFGGPLGLEEDQTGAQINYWSMVTYFLPIIGAICADSFVGKFRTILYFGIIYATGQIVLTFGSFGNSPDGPFGVSWPYKVLSYIGLYTMAVGTGGIKPCIGPFGAEQVWPLVIHFFCLYFLFFGSLRS